MKNSFILIAVTKITRFSTNQGNTTKNQNAIKSNLIDLLERRSGGGSNILGGKLSLGLVGSPALGLAIEEALSILVKFELGDHHLRWVDPDIDSGTIDLLPGDALNMYDPLPAIHLNHLSLTALEGAAHHLNLVVLADGH